MLSPLGNQKCVRELEEDFAEEENLHGFYSHTGATECGSWESNFRRKTA